MSNTPPYAGPYDFKLMEFVEEELILRCVRFEPEHDPPLYFQEDRIKRNDPLPQYVASGNTTSRAMKRIENWRKGISEE